jgi:hypothetical protein
MSLEEKVEQVSKVMKELKERWVDDVAGTDRNTDLGIYLHFWRDEEIISTVVCNLDRDTGLKVGMMGAKGFNATCMSITFESYHSELPESPLSRQPWRPHEMQFVFQTNPNQDWVTECLTTTIHERGGSFALNSDGYKIVDGHVVWGHRQLHFLSGVDEGEGQGFMFDYLQQAMAEPLLMTTLQEESEKSELAKLMLSLVDDPEEQMFHADAATARLLLDRELAHTVLLGAEPGSKRERWIEERFGET